MKHDTNRHTATLSQSLLLILLVHTNASEKGTTFSIDAFVNYSMTSQFINAPIESVHCFNFCYIFKEMF